MSSLVRKARINTGLSIVQAAKLLGISAGYLSQIETGKRQVSKERATQIAKLYKKNRDELFSPTRFRGEE